MPLDDDAVGLRALSNGKFARVRAPGDEAAWDAPWTVEFASPLPGLAERFQLRTVPKPSAQDDVVKAQDDPWSGMTTSETKAWAPSFRMLYSELMRGFIQCNGGGVSEPVRGFSGEAADESRVEFQFNLTRADAATMAKARELLRASKHAEELRAKADANRRARLLAASAERGEKFSLKPGERLPRRGPSALDSGSLKVAIVVPMTSRGTDMDGVEQSPLWFNLFASFVESVDWRKNRHTFHFYLGFDKGDDLYDTGDAWSEMRRAFRAHAKKALRWLGYGNFTVARVADGIDGSKTGRRFDAGPFFGHGRRAVASGLADGEDGRRRGRGLHLSVERRHYFGLEGLVGDGVEINIVCSMAWSFHAVRPTFPMMAWMFTKISA